MTAPSDPVEAIKRLYYETTQATILRDLDRAIALLKAMPDDAMRERAAVYMDGLAQMRTEWAAQTGTGPRPRRRPRA